MSNSNYKILRAICIQLPSDVNNYFCTNFLENVQKVKNCEN